MISPFFSLAMYSVPLADDDDWGWDDSGGGDVELASRAQHQEDDDLRMAMALSLSESPTVPRPKQMGTATRRSNSGNRSTFAATTTEASPADGKFSIIFVLSIMLLRERCRVLTFVYRNDDTDWDDWDDPTRVTPAPVSAPLPVVASIPNPPPQSIASLGPSRQQNARRKPPAPPKPPQDDIFASMGLTAKPSFTSPRTTTQAAPTSSGLAAAAQEAAGDVGEEWGDDSDLDDLLDD